MDFITFNNFHHYDNTFEYDNGWTKINHVLPEGIRPRRIFCNRRNSMREMMTMGNNSCAAIDHYDYTSHKLDNTHTYAIGTGYNESKKMLVMVHSADVGFKLQKKQFTYSNLKDLNKVTKIKDYFDNLTATEYFTGTWTTDNNRDMTVVGNKLGWIWTQKR